VATEAKELPEEWAERAGAMAEMEELVEPEERMEATVEMAAFSRNRFSFSRPHNKLRLRLLPLIKLQKIKSC